MSRTFSVAEARDRLSSLIHQVEEDGPVELTRRGRPVAVVLSIDDYQQLKVPRPGLSDVISDLRSRVDMEALDIEPDEIFGEFRSREPGRSFAW